MKGIRRFGIKVKLARHYISLYSIIDKYGPMSYQMELPARLSGVHNVFQVSQLKRCLKPPTDVVIEDTIPLKPDLTYKTYLIMVLDQQDRITRNKTTRFYKVQWSDHSEDEDTWEHEEFLQFNYHEFLPSREPPHPGSLLCIHFNLEARFLLRGEGCNTPCCGNPNQIH
jgi:hypothetical protein